MNKFRSALVIINASPTSQGLNRKARRDLARKARQSSKGKSK